MRCNLNCKSDTLSSSSSNSVQNLVGTAILSGSISPSPWTPYVVFEPFFSMQLH